MGLRIIQGDGEGDSGTYTVLYCSTSMRALPWIFEDREDAQAFLDKHGDIRCLPHEEAQHRLYDAWRCGSLDRKIGT